MSTQHVYEPGPVGTLCQAEPSGARCNLPENSEWHLPAAGVTVTMRYTEAEPSDWGKGHVYPPSDDEGASLNRGSIASQMAPVREHAEWELAVTWLKTPDCPLLYGPWPVRKFILWDLADGMDGDSHYKEMQRTLGSLDTLEQDYCLVVSRAEGAAYRVALLTWNWARGYTIEVACDELAAMYG